MILSDVWLDFSGVHLNEVTLYDIFLLIKWVYSLRVYVKFRAIVTGGHVHL